MKTSIKKTVCYLLHKSIISQYSIPLLFQFSSKEKSTFINNKSNQPLNFQSHNLLYTFITFIIAAPIKKSVQIILFSILTYTSALGQEKVTTVSNPKNILVEIGENKKYLNFDFLVKNNSSDTLFISKIVATVYDKNNYIIYQRFLDHNGTAPSIQTIPNKQFIAKQSKLIFNPFSEFDLGITLDKIEFQSTFTSNQDEETLVKTVINPKSYVQEEKYVFPLKGKMLVYDAHDFYSHHRRFDYEFEPIKQLVLPVIL